MFMVTERAVIFPVLHALESTRPLFNYFPGLDVKFLRFSKQVFGENITELMGM